MVWGSPVSRELRDVLGQFATGVTIVTAVGKGGAVVGMTVNSFSSLSLDPPLILWCLANTALGRDEYRDADHFCINVLAAGQQDLATQFAKTENHKFKDIDFVLGPGGVPKLGGCIAWLDCRRHAVEPGGDHDIIIGLVEGHRRAAGAPLLFFDGQFMGGYQKSAEHK